MNFREIIELAKRRGLQAGKAKKIDIIAAIQSGRVYTRAEIPNEDGTGMNNMMPAHIEQPLYLREILASHTP